MRRPRALALIGIGVALSAGVYLFWPKESLASVGDRVIGCTAKGDADCVWPHIMNDEKAALSLTKEKLAILLRSEIEPVYGPLPHGPTITEGSRESGTAMCSRTYSGSGGSPQGLGLVVAMTDEGIKCPHYVAAIVSCLTNVKYWRPDMGSGLPKLNAMATLAEKDGPRLAAMGIPGIYRDEKEGLLTWTAWAENCRERYAKAEAAERNHAHGQR